MEPCKISKLLNNSTQPKSVTKKWIKVNDLSNEQRSVNKNIKFKTPILRSNLCDYNNTYIFVKGTITAAGTNVINRTNGQVAFKNNAPFKSCISKINKTWIDKEEDLDIDMSMYNLLEYSNNYSMKSNNWKIVELLQR